MRVCEKKNYQFDIRDLLSLMTFVYIYTHCKISNCYLFYLMYLYSLNNGQIFSTQKASMEYIKRIYEKESFYKIYSLCFTSLR